MLPFFFFATPLLCFLISIDILGTVFIWFGLKNIFLN